MPALLPGRAVEEQLCELTRLVLRLPEVDSLLQGAGLQPTAPRVEPTSVLEMFVKVMWSVNGVNKGVCLCIWKCYSRLVLDLLLKEMRINKK